MSRARWIPTIVTALALIALTPGCGGGGKDQVSVAELIQKGDQICRTEQAKFAQIQAHPPANASNAADQTKELIQAAESAGSQLGDLEPPDALRAAFESYLSARNRAVDQMKRGQDAADDQDSRAYGAAQAAVVHTAPARRKLARSVGFKVCGSSPGAT
jgi:hypothetical protein